MYLLSKWIPLKQPAPRVPSRLVPMPMLGKTKHDGPSQPSTLPAGLHGADGAMSTASADACYPPPRRTVTIRRAKSYHFARRSAPARPRFSTGAKCVEGRGCVPEGPARRGHHALAAGIHSAARGVNGRPAARRTTSTRTLCEASVCAREEMATATPTRRRVTAGHSAGIYPPQLRGAGTFNP